MHVKAGYFFTSPKRVTSPTWGPPPPCKQALRTKISWMHFGRFPFTQILRNFGNSGNWYSIFPEKFPDFRKSLRNANLSTRNFRHSGANLNAERKLPDDNFRKFVYVLRKCCSIQYCKEVAENLNQTF